MLTENLTLKVQADCQYSGVFVNFEHCYLALAKRKEKKMILLSVLNQFVERAANFTELVILKQVPSLSGESFMDCQMLI